jgi:hypothetical protein
MRYPALVVALFLASFGLAQDFSKPITYTTRAVPFRQVLAELSKQAGVKLEASLDMEEEPLILRVAHEPLKTVMDRIAEVFGADWVDHHGFWRLERSDARVAALRQALVDQRAKAIERNFEELRKADSDMAGLDGAGADEIVKAMYDAAKKRASGDTSEDDKVTALWSRLPAPRLTRAIALAMDPAELAAIPVGTRVVFSTSPNPMQRLLPSLPDEVLQRFNRERGLISASLQKQVPQQERGYVTELMGPSSAPISRIVVASIPIPQDETLHLNFHYLDADGAQISEDSLDLVHTITEYSNSQESYIKLRQQALKDGFPLSPIAMEIAPRTSGQADLRPLSKEAEDILLHPTERDPLSIATSDIVLTAAETLGENAICLATDGTEYFALNAGRLGKTSLAAFEAVAASRCGMSFDEENSWLVGKPNDPLDAESGRVPRTLLEKFVQDSVARGYVSLDIAVDLCAAAPPECDFQLAEEWSRFLLPDRGLQTLGTDPNMLRLFGSLSPIQRDGAKKGKITLHMADLDAAQREVASRWFYNGFNALEQADRSPGAMQNVQLQERTEFFPNGLPNDMALEVTDSSKPVFFEQIEQFAGGEYTMSLPAEGLPEEIAQTQHPELFRIVNPSKLEKLTTGSERTLTMRLVLGGKSAADTAREEHRAPGEMMTIDQYLSSLSGEEREKLEAQIAAILDRAGKQSGNAPPVAPPAPPGGGVKPPA